MSRTTPSKVDHPGDDMPNLDARLLARPLYSQVRDILVQRILGGDWKPGAAIPNETMLAQQMGISIGTVRKALDLMETERIVTRRQGRGTFVNDFTEQPLFFSSFVNRDGAHVVGEKRAKLISRVAANDEEALRLKIAIGDEILKVERIRFHQNQPFLTEVCRLPGRLFKKLPEDLASYRLSVLAQQNSMIVSDAKEAISLSAATPSDALDLNVAEGAPLIALDRIIYSERGDCLEWRVGRSFMRNERFVVKYH